jgi:dimethylaniline monooxygenase (N-oxide forming)
VKNMQGMRDAGIIGAGPCGLVALKRLREAGIDVVCLDRHDKPGGLWSSGRKDTPAYENLTANTSRRVMEFADFPISDEFAIFPTREEITQYVDAYCDAFSLRDRVIGGVEVVDARRDEDGLWRLSVAQGGNGAGSCEWPERFRSLIVATGQACHPKLLAQAVLNEISVPYIHAREYWNAEALLSRGNKRVLIVGLGSSALDIAIDLAQSDKVAEVLIAARSGRYLIPKFSEGKQFDEASLNPAASLPWFAQHFPALAEIVTQRIIANFFKAVGDRYIRSVDLGLPKPNFPPWAKPASISEDIRPYLLSGRIKARYDIKAFEGDLVWFRDGSKAQVDVVVLCTGYEWRFPFLKTECALVDEDAEKGGEIHTHNLIAHSRIPNLYFIGLTNQTCSILPLSEQQAIWLAWHLKSNRWHRDKSRPGTRELLLSKPFNNICNFYVHELQRDIRRMAKREATASAGR